MEIHEYYGGPREIKVGGWAPQQATAWAERFGLRWFRTDFGGRGDRTDWIAEVPGLCVSISRWHTDPEGMWSGFGGRDGVTMDEAMIAEIETTIGAANFTIPTLIRKIAAAEDGRRMLHEALAEARNG